MKPAELRAALLDLGWSGAVFAERIGVHPNTVSKWLNGKAEMPGPALAYLRLSVRIAELARFAAPLRKAL